VGLTGNTERCCGDFGRLWSSGGRMFWLNLGGFKESSLRGQEDWNDDREWGGKW